MLEGGERYRVEETLKQGETETTELVVDDASERFIRKRIKLSSGTGAAYEEIHAAQERGETFEHLPRVFEAAREGDELVVVMELVSGETLQDVVYYCDPSPKLALQLFGGICDAVTELHTRFTPPIIHRDLKPTNIIINESGAHLIDFDIARTYKDEAQNDTTHFGTRGYAPPEQFGFGQTNERSDVYALGMVLYYLLTEQNADTHTREKGFTDRRIPEPLRAVLMKATEFAPDARYASVEELKAAFLNAMREWEPQKEHKGDDVEKKATAASEGERSQENPIHAGDADRTAWVKEKRAGKRGSKAKSMEMKAPAFAVPRWIGVTWNALLAIAWITWMGVCIGCVLAPEGTISSWPRWATFLVYIVLVGGTGTAVFWMLLDKRRLKARFPKFPAPVWRKQILIVIGIFFLVVAIAIIPIAATGIA